MNKLDKLQENANNSATAFTHPSDAPSGHNWKTRIGQNAILSGWDDQIIFGEVKVSIGQWAKMRWASNGKALRMNKDFDVFDALESKE